MGFVDIMSGIDTNLLLRVSARKLKTTKANMKKDEKRFVAARINNKGTKVFLLLMNVHDYYV